jgi:hypothetical protein
MAKMYNTVLNKITIVYRCCECSHIKEVPLYKPMSARVCGECDNDIYIPIGVKIISKGIKTRQKKED